jgi:hypothetical protein
MLSTWRRLLSALILVLAAAGCDGSASHRETFAELLKTNEDLLAVLKQVKDEASMEKARPELRKISWRSEKIAKRLKALGQPSSELMAEMAEPLAAVRKEVTKEALRITHLPGGQDFVDAMKHL